MKRQTLMMAMVLILTGCVHEVVPVSTTETHVVERIANDHEINSESMIEVDETIENTVIQSENTQKEFAEELVIEHRESITMTYSFLGDITTGNFIEDYIAELGVDYPWKHVHTLLHEDTLTIGNLEMSIGLEGETLKPEGYNFMGKPYTLEGLYNAGIDVVSVANNHSLDYGEALFIEGLDTIEDYGLASIGGGVNVVDATAPYIMEIDHVRVGMIAYNDIIPWNTWIATDSSAGVAAFSSDDYEHVLNQINLLKEEVDLLFVILHWGIEYATFPEKWQIEVAHHLIDQGADGVIGHHPHVMQGVEVYKEKPILYSIGNFLFVKKNEDAGKSGIFQLIYEDNRFKGLAYHPIQITYGQAKLCGIDSSEGQAFIALLNERSINFGTEFDKNGLFLLEN